MIKKILILMGFILALFSLRNCSYKIIQKKKYIIYRTTDNIQLIPNSDSIRSIEVIATAYTPSKDETDNTPLITANGETLKFKQNQFSGTIAISQDLFRYGFNFGDSVIIEDSMLMGMYKINDVMHRRWKKRIDICVKDKRLAYKIGRRRVKLYKIWE